MIKMIGIDHTTASVDERSVFAYRKSEMASQMLQIKKQLEATGIVLISTCNRMEVWVNIESDNCDAVTSKARMLDALCQVKSVEKSDYENNFIYRESDEAIEHLMWMTSGLKSAIIAEDQILTQVKDAIDFARQERLADSPLDVLFRTAVTTAKKIKTEVVFHRANTSAIDKALGLLEQEAFNVSGKKCLVIGNGEYGRLVSNTLVEKGADVTVTIRQYHSGEVLIPKGCKTILYGDKYNVFPECELVVSATTSPNYTLFYDKVKACNVNHRMILIDLAVPRDVDPLIKELDNYTVFDIDDFKTDSNSQNKEAFEQATLIMQEKIDEFHSWYDYRDIIPVIAKIKENSVRDIELRIEKDIRKLGLDEKNEEKLKKRIEDASGKVISNIFYKLRDNLDEATFRKCIQTMWENEDE